MNALVYVNIDQGIHKGKMKVAQNEKRKKLLGFPFYINIGNFEAFLWNLNLSTNCLFCRYVPKYPVIEIVFAPCALHMYGLDTI